MIRDRIVSLETRVGRRKRQTRERIFQTALDLFVEKGLDETTVAEIAEAADIGKGTFFTYFPSKESIFAEVSAQLVDAMETGHAAAQAAGASIESRILALFQPAIDWHASNPVLSRYMLAAFMRDSASIQADRVSQRRLYERLALQLAEAQAAGSITRDVELTAAITVIAGTYFGSLGAWHGAETRTPLAADFARSLQIVFRGLRP
jgi:AcrR family transcriptional regulator